MPALMAAVALGMARLKTNRRRLAQICFALLLVPGVAYSACQLLLLARPDGEARQIQSFKAASVSPDAAAVTMSSLSAAFANRDQALCLSVSTPQRLRPRNVQPR